MEFLLNLNVKPLRTNVKPPYWRLSGDGSGEVRYKIADDAYWAK